jgi:AraC-like DNA-binding protein
MFLDMVICVYLKVYLFTYLHKGAFMSLLKSIRMEKNKIVKAYVHRYSYTSAFTSLWLLVLIYMFKNPIVLFGESYLLKNIELNDPQEFLVWSRKPLKIVEEKDKIVYNTILKRIGFIIADIQILQKSDEILSTTTFTTDTLAKQLKIPRRHLEFVFKYFCHYSISDFGNLVKVNYAVSLINDGYLDSYTVESLGEKCLFNSRFTFSKNFKKFIGVSVSDFVNSTVKL